MAYTKHNFKNGDILHADDLNELEDAIAEIENLHNKPQVKKIHVTDGFCQFRAPKGSTYSIKVTSRNLLSNDRFTKQTKVAEGKYFLPAKSAMDGTEFTPQGSFHPDDSKVYYMFDGNPIKVSPGTYWVGYTCSISDSEYASIPSDYNAY
jgi:hypothetical protein